MSATGAGPATPILEARDLVVSYGAINALKGITIRLMSDEIVTLIGANGAGKSTTLRAILGLVPPARGEIRFRGASTSGVPTYKLVRQGLTLVPEGRAIFANLSVRENLMLAARPPHDSRPNWTLERVLSTFPRLKERLAFGGQQLSGGEQQMLAIGRALMSNPDILILDEATEGLAPLIVREIWRIIAEIRASGIASLLVDRNYRLVLAHTDRAVVMEKGMLVLEGWSASLAQRTDALTRHLGV